tara:strand:- start:418 stop:1434 length:1017 start_codon:yes stop_codon:yes gene_type:complete
MSKKALITGISGQDGSYLAQYLLKEGYKVFGLERRSASNDSFRLKYLDIYSDVEIFNIDLIEHASIIKLISLNQFDEIYNLAAQSFVGDSWDNAISTSEINSIGVVNILDSIRQFSSHTKFYQASTSEMFGMVQATPQNENTPFYPRSPYGVSKLYSHWITINYRESFKLHSCSGILFNHESPLRGIQFVTKKIINGLCNFLNNKQSIRLGNLDAKRDWGFAGDYVKAMHLMLKQKSPDDYVIGTGIETSVRDFCSIALNKLELKHTWTGSGLNEKCILEKDKSTIIEVSPQFFRPAEVNSLLADTTKAKEILGWESETSLDELIDLMINYELKMTNN